MLQNAGKSEEEKKQISSLYTLDDGGQAKAEVAAGCCVGCKAPAKKPRYDYKQEAPRDSLVRFGSDLESARETLQPTDRDYRTSEGLIDPQRKN